MLSVRVLKTLETYWFQGFYNVLLYHPISTDFHRIKPFVIFHIGGYVSIPSNSLSMEIKRTHSVNGNRIWEV